MNQRLGRAGLWLARRKRPPGRQSWRMALLRMKEWQRATAMYGLNRDRYRTASGSDRPLQIEMVSTAKAGRYRSRFGNVFLTIGSPRPAVTPGLNVSIWLFTNA